MITLRLFHKDDPFRQLEARGLEDGELAIGRDPGVGWTVSDPSKTLSRNHCVIAVQKDRLTLQDLSSNGVFLGRERVRALRGSAAPIDDGETLYLGEFLIVVEREVETRPVSPDAASVLDAPFDTPILAPVTASALPATAGDWASPVDHANRRPDESSPAAAAVAPPPRSATNQGALLELFCAGAHLDVSAFSEEDPAEVMHRLGAVYQQMVLGLVELMGERTTVRGEFRMDQTTVRADGNNPFRWASADRVAVDLLRANEAGFMIGPKAVKASFADVRKHLICVLAGMRGALRATLDGLSPAATEKDNRGQAFLLKGRAAGCWSAYVERHGRLQELADTDPKNPINEGFRVAYGRQLRELDGSGGCQ